MSHFCTGCVTLKAINPPFKPQQARELATSSCTQDVTDTEVNPVCLQNKTPCADRFVLLNHLWQSMTYGRMHVSTVFFSPEAGSEIKDGKGR